MLCKVYVENDARSLFRWMRVKEVIGSHSTGLKHLVLVDLVPPWSGEAEEHPVGANEDWRIKYARPHLQWQVISPASIVKHSHIASADEARNRARLESGNPKPR
jgi:hypothetical protein